MNLSEAIKVTMFEKSITNAHVIQVTGWSESYVSGCRHGKVNPLPRLDQWCAVLGEVPSRFLKRAEEIDSSKRAA